MHIFNNSMMRLPCEGMNVHMNFHKNTLGDCSILKYEREKEIPSSFLPFSNLCVHILSVKRV